MRRPSARWCAQARCVRSPSTTRPGCRNTPTFRPPPRSGAPGPGRRWTRWALPPLPALAPPMTTERLSMNIQTSPAAAATYGLLVDRDVDVPMRDGARLKADVIRPDDGGKFPAILNLGPYQKDKVWVPPDSLEEKPNPLMNWETVNPEWWVPKGYACVRVDGRGSGKSPGQCEPWSLQEAIDCYDAIEWAAAQPWCNGKVGLNGISYFAINQWFVANLQPPSLKAIIPW